jgi:2-oxo-4-hydroxy-4-carboxy-5-ureidoimidazoline decarboxylase
MLKKVLLTVAASTLLALSVSVPTAAAADHVMMADLNKMSQADFEKALAKVFERAPWVIKATGEMRPYKGFVDMYMNMVSVVQKADKKTKLALIQSHPDLACKGIRPEVTAHSQSEQAGAGLDQCSQDEADKLAKLTSEYKQKNGFPFMLAVKGFNKAEIFEQIETRIKNAEESEFETALQQVYKVVLWRLLDTAK